MIYPVPFRAEHYARMTIYDAQAWLAQHATVDRLRVLEGDNSGTLMRDGEPVFCGGVIPMWENRVLAWAFFDAAPVKADFRTVHGYARNFLDSLPYRRVEAAVPVSYEEGHRWVRALGFGCETPAPLKMRAYQADGQDCLLYARIREDV